MVEATGRVCGSGTVSPIGLIGWAPLAGTKVLFSSCVRSLWSDGVGAASCMCRCRGGPNGVVSAPDMLGGVSWSILVAMASVSGGVSRLWSGLDVVRALRSCVAGAGTVLPCFVNTGPCADRLFVTVLSAGCVAKGIVSVVGVSLSCGERATVCVGTEGGGAHETVVVSWDGVLGMSDSVFNSDLVGSVVWSVCLCGWSLAGNRSCCASGDLACAVSSTERGWLSFDDFWVSVVWTKVSLSCYVGLTGSEWVTLLVGGTALDVSMLDSESCVCFGAPVVGETSDREVLIGGHSSMVRSVMGCYVGCVVVVWSCVQVIRGLRRVGS